MRSQRFLLAVLAVLAVAVDVSSQAPPPKPAAKPTPPPPPVLEGVVRGPGRKPVENALVAATPVVPAIGMRYHERMRPVWTRTGADGRFRLVLRAHEPHTVRVEAPGLAAATRKDVSPGTTLSFDLTPGGSIEGTVRDGDSGQPVANLRVVARQPRVMALPGEPDAGRVVARTDASGRFKLQGLASGPYQVFASGRGRGSARRGSVRPGTRVDLLVFPSGSVYGTVLGADGRPVPGATVATSRSAGDAEPVDDRGAFELNGLEPGVYDLVARAHGLAPAVAAEVTIDRRTEARIELVLRPGARVVGRLVDGSERPLAGRVGVGEMDGRPVPGVLQEPLTTGAGADGRFVIDGVPVGAHALGVEARGFARERVDVAVRDGDRQVDVGDVLMEVGNAIRGRVRSKAGQPIPDAVVRTIELRAGGELSEVRSEADGTFVLAGLQAGAQLLLAEAAGFGQEQKRAEAGGEPVEFVLSPAATITGRVVDGRSQPVESFRVIADAAGTGARLLRTPWVEETGSEDGRFTLTSVAAGTYAVTASAPERAPSTLKNVTVAEGQAVDIGTLTLAAGGVVRGTVVDPEGAAVSGATVAAAPPPQATGQTVESITDAAGAFELSGVAPGSAVVVASHPSYAGGEPVTVEVDAAKPTTDVRVVLTAGGRIEGRVRSRDGSGREGVGVSASPMGRYRPIASAALSATTQSDGSFVLEHVPAGSANVIVMARGGAAAGMERMRTVDVREGETTTLDVVDREILLSGRVTRSGAPAAGLRIDASSAQRMMIVGRPHTGAPPAPPTGPQPMTATTRDDGSFEMLVDEPGTYGLSVATVDGRVRLPARQVVVPDADAHAVELSFDGGSVDGIVVDKETEAPVPHAEIVAFSKEKGIAHGQAGPDGRFHLEVEAGEYSLRASARDGGYAPSEAKTVTVGEDALADVKLSMARGRSITGKVTRASGAPAGGADVQAMWSGAEGSGGGNAQARPDGTFEVRNLEEGRYTVIAEGEDGAFAMRPNVSTGDAVTLALRPGARLSVTVTLPSGGPAPGVYPNITHVDGLHVGSAGHTLAPTDAQGRTEMIAPAGECLVWAIKQGPGGEKPLTGGAKITVSSGDSASVAIEIREGGLPPP